MNESAQYFVNEMAKKFTDDYLVSLNKSIFKIIAFFELKNETEAQNNIEQLLSPIYLNQYNYINSIVERNKRNNCEITSIKRLGDIHNQGKCTVLVETNLSKLIYKPFQVDLLELLNDFINILNGSQYFNFHLLKIASNTKSLSVIEFIQNQKIVDCHRFSYHYGALIFLLTLLRGTDFHYENILCFDSTPVIVDCESLFVPELLHAKKYDVEATSMIPTEGNKMSWMSKDKLLTLKIADGIKDACQVIRENMDVVSKLICAGEKKMRRLILKPTSFYQKVLVDSLHPVFLTNQHNRKAFVEKCFNGNHVISQAILSSETYDILHLDIPFFTYQNNVVFNSRGKEIKQCVFSNPVGNIKLDMDNMTMLSEELIRRVYQYE